VLYVALAPYVPPLASSSISCFFRYSFIGSIS
jgi:hypothetical protein